MHIRKDLLASVLGLGIKGNSHMLFQELNNVEIADLIAES